MDIKDILIKKELDVNYFLEILSNYEEDDFIYPDGKNDHFNVFNQLAEIGIILKQIIPIWIDGQYKGTKISFIYKHDLDYSLYYH